MKKNISSMTSQQKIAVLKKVYGSAKNPKIATKEELAKLAERLYS